LQGTVVVVPRKEIVMTSSARDLVGLEAVSRDGDKIGLIRDVISDPSFEYLVVSYSLFYDAIVPVSATERRGDRVFVLLMRSYLDVVLRDAFDGARWHESRSRPEGFPRSRAA
jgi:hypothetical protein